MTKHRPRFDRIEDYDSILDYLNDAPVGEVGEAMIEIELAHPVDSFMKRRAIRKHPVLGEQFTPSHWQENWDALFDMDVAWLDFPDEMALIAERHGRTRSV